jgi:hypothetical protein
MMLIAALIIWFILVISFVTLCRVAAAADARDAALAQRYPSASTRGASTFAAGLVIWDEQPSLVLAEERARARGARERAGRYAAGS